MFERFTESAKSVLTEAQDVAVGLRSRNIGVLHLLYGCAEVRDEAAGAVLRDRGITADSIRALLSADAKRADRAVDPDALRAIGIDYDAVLASVEQTFGSGALDAAPDRRVAEGTRRPPFTVEAKRSLELALRVAIELRATRMVPGHLLLGLLRLDDEQIVDVLERAETSVADISAAVLTRLSAAA
jgi:ATP-dependent Clp protease ATP-binding subunit ClpA